MMIRLKNITFCVLTYNYVVRDNNFYFHRSIWIFLNPVLHSFRKSIHLLFTTSIPNNFLATSTFIKRTPLIKSLFTLLDKFYYSVKSSTVGGV